MELAAVYNYLCSGNPQSWSRSVWTIDRYRFLEHTAPSIEEKFKTLTPAKIAELKSYPCLLACEGNEQPVRLAQITNINETTHSITVEHQFLPGVPPISATNFIPLRPLLDIQNSQISRTHWAVKSADLIAVLRKHKLIKSSVRMPNQLFVKIDDISFDIAVSFPGEKRVYVKKVIDQLKALLPDAKVFYDFDYQGELARPNLDVLLQKIYMSNSRLVVIFLSSEYNEKEWCGIEWRAIRNVIHKRDDLAIMPLKFDKVEVDGLLQNDGYLDIEGLRPAKVALYIAQRIHTIREHNAKRV